MFSSSMNLYGATKNPTFAIFTLLLLTTPYAAAQSSPDAHDDYGMTPSMATIIVVLISATFFMGFFTIYIRHCTDAAGGGVRPVGGPARRSRQREAARGLDADTIKSFPTFAYSTVKGFKIGKGGALECAVCLSEFEDNETLRLIPKCDHVFHVHCIDVWLASHTTCPVCRANLTPQPIDSELQPNSGSDLEAQNDAIEIDPEGINDHDNRENTNAEAINTRRPKLGTPRKFMRSHSMGYSLVQPGKNTDRFTLRLPVEVQKQIMSRELNRTMSMVVLNGERSSKKGYRMGDEGSGSSGCRGKHLSSKPPDWSDQKTKSDRWVINITQPIFARASSFLTRGTSSFKSPRSPKVATNSGEGTSSWPVGQDGAEPTQPPV